MRLEFVGQIDCFLEAPDRLVRVPSPGRRQTGLDRRVKLRAMLQQLRQKAASEKAEARGAAIAAKSAAAEATPKPIPQS